MMHTLRPTRIFPLLIALMVILGLALPAAAETDGATRPVVFIGVPGLAWSDVSQETTPAMWQGSQSSVGSLIVRSLRTATCPLDGWLALNSSSRAAGLSNKCDVLVDPVDGLLRVWPQVQEAVAEQNYSAKLGRLADNLTDAKISSIAIGPGAAVALADEDGRVKNYAPRHTPGEGLANQITTALNDHDVLIVDAGEIRTAPHDAYSTKKQFRADHVRIMNKRIGAIWRGIDSSAKEPTIILAALADDANPALRVLAISGPGWPRGQIGSPSTRQPGYSLATDLQATLLAELGATTSDHHGTVIQTSPETASVSELVEDAQDRERHSTLMRPIIPTFFFIMVVVNLALYAAVTIGLKRPTIARLNAWWHRRTGKVPPETDGTWLPPRTGVLRVMRAFALAVGALPVASYLANFVPWWRFDLAPLVLAGIILLADVVLVAIALGGPWRREPLGPATVIAGATALVLAADVVSGSPLQLGSVMGNPPLVAGRFYGMNNTAFAQFTTAMILLTITSAQPFVRRGKRWAAVCVILVFGGVTAFLDGAPFLGADFGGPPAILPAFLIMALLAGGVRITWKRATGVFLATALIVLAIAFADWLRPPAVRTHIGNFFQQILDGDLLPVILRKLDANLRVLAGNRPLTLLALSAVATVVFVLARPIRSEIAEPRGGRFAWLSAGTPLNEMSARTPLLGSGVVAAAIVAALGMALNDSGIAIPANMAAVLVPLLLAGTATWMLSLGPEPNSRAPALEPRGSWAGPVTPPDELDSQ